ncbi:MAG: NAD(P)-binding protein [Calditrichaeota bacterium]|nr:NAD(P)-binding protein [Calditrichota bacterium]
MPHTDLIIVGGGWAGLAAATAALQRGLSVKLFELSAELGGRSGAFRDNNFDEWLDIGPHVFIGAYKRTFSLLDTWGSKDGIDFGDGGNIPWIYPNNRTEWLKTGDDRSKLSAFLNLLSFNSISLPDRLRTANILRVVPDLRNLDPHTEPTVKGFLRKYGIDVRKNVFWYNLAVAVMNGAPETVGAWPLVRALREGLTSGGSVARIGVTRQNFQKFFCDYAEKYLKSNGCGIFKRSSVTSVKLSESGKVKGVKLKDGECESNNVLLAVSPLDASRLLPGSVRNKKFFRTFSTFDYSPIASVHLNYSCPVLEHPFACLPGGLAEWVFGRGEQEHGGWSRVNTVTSASPGMSEISRDEFLDRVILDLAERLPKAKPEIITEARLVRSKRATVILKPGSDLIRPEAVTPTDGLFIAGDWCGTGLPATIESAARSGWDAVQQIRKQ